jgi:hypothetical protein
LVSGVRGPGFGGRDFARIHNRHVHIFREPRRIWIGGIMRTIVPIAALTGVYLGANYYYPDGYVTLARPYCRGLTPEGCTLRWQEVPLDGGGADWQCVQFCPQVAGAVPPAPVTTGIAPPPVPLAEMPAAGGSCELTIFSDANFAGMSAPTSED